MRLRHFTVSSWIPTQDMATISSLSIKFFLSIFILVFAASLSSSIEFQLPPNVTSPYSFALDKTITFYTSVIDGRVLKYEGSETGFTDFAFTTPTRSRAVCDGTTDPDSGPICGRPLGLSFNLADNKLFIADAYYGLLAVSPNGGLATTLATSAEGVPFNLTNGLDVDPKSGAVYFSDFSTTIQLRNLSRAIFDGRYAATYSSDATGRLLRYDPDTQSVTVMLRDLAGASGTAVNQDGEFVLVSEFNANKILRLWLKGPRAYTVETFVSFIGRPVNIRRTAKGDFWVAVNNFDNQSSTTPRLTGQRINSFGVIQEIVNLDDQYGPSTFISEVQQYKWPLYVGATGANFVGVYTPN